MTKKWPYIEVICGHCSTRSSGNVVVVGFRHRHNRWEPVGAAGRVTLRGDQPQSVDELFPVEPNPVPTREDLTFTCRMCGKRKLERREEKLHDELYMLAHIGITRLDVETFSRLTEPVLIVAARLGFTELTVGLVNRLAEIPCDSLAPDT